MTETKEKILMTALSLFASDGYEAVSVSTIAGKLGMTKGALYKHYKNKQDIFDSIVKRMYKIDSERSEEYEVPKETYEENPKSYTDVSLEQIRKFTVAQFSFWTEDKFASDFRRMLTLEQYRNPEMAKLYSNCLSMGPVSYMRDIFAEMKEKNIIVDEDPQQLAIEFYSPLYLLINVCDGMDNKDELVNLLERHIDNFFKAYIHSQNKERNRK